MRRLLLVLCLAVLTFVSKAEAAIEVKGSTFTGDATASIHCTVGVGQSSGAFVIDYEGPILLAMATRVEHSSTCPPWMIVPYLNVHFSFTTLDSARLNSQLSGVFMDVVRFQSYGGLGGAWPYPVQYVCDMPPQYYVGMICPGLTGALEFKIVEFTTDGNAFRFGLAPYNSAALADGSATLAPTDGGVMTISGEGVVPVMENTWGQLKQRFGK